MFEHDVAKWTVAFGIAALVHASQVRKEIKTQFGIMTAAINNVSTMLGAEIQAQMKITTAIRQDVTELRTDVNSISSRVQTLEKI